MSKAKNSRCWQNRDHIFKKVLRDPIVGNAASLYLIQISQYVIPLVTVPYLVRVLGPTGYGTVAIGQSFISFFVLFVDYGFAFSATRKIASERDDPLALSRTVFNVWGAKCLLSVLGFIALLLVSAAVPRLHENRQLFVILYGTVMGSVLMPVWLFQGLERMVPLSAINLGLQMCIAIGIFVFVHQESDYILYAEVTSACYLAAGFVGAVIALSRFNLRPMIPSWKGIRETFSQGWMMFLASASISLYTVGNTFILGLIANPAAAGYFYAAERIARAAVSMVSPITQAVYPRLSNLASVSGNRVVSWSRRMFLVMGGMGFAFSLALFVGAPAIVGLLLGPDYLLSIPALRILSLLPFLISISSVSVIQLMFPRHYERVVFYLALLTGIISVMLAVLLVPILYETGMAIAELACEIFMTVSSLVFIWHKGLLKTQEMAH